MSSFSDFLGKATSTLGSIANPVSALGSLVSGVSSLFGPSRAQQRRMYEWQLKKNVEAQDYLAQQQFARQMDAWQQNNEYNTPSAQKQRLIEAGLLGTAQSQNASLASSSGSQMPTISTPSAATPQGIVSANAAAEQRNLNLDTALKLAQIAVTNSQARKNDSEAGRAASDTVLNKIRGDYFTALSGQAESQTTLNEALALSQNIDNQFASGTLNVRMDQVKASYQQTLSQIDNIKTLTGKARVDAFNSIVQTLSQVAVNEALVSYYNSGAELNAENIGLVRSMAQLYTQQRLNAQTEEAASYFDLTGRHRSGYGLRTDASPEEISASALRDYRSRAQTGRSPAETRWMQNQQNFSYKPREYSQRTAIAISQGAASVVGAVLGAAILRSPYGAVVGSSVGSSLYYPRSTSEFGQGYRR